jgi:class 3 adenylate cyclase
MTAAITRLNQVVSDIIATNDGVRPVEQGEGDSFVAAFARASDAVAAAVELQRAPLAPIRLRIGVGCRVGAGWYPRRRPPTTVSQWRQSR